MFWNRFAHVPLPGPAFVETALNAIVLEMSNTTVKSTRKGETLHPQLVLLAKS